MKKKRGTFRVFLRSFFKKLYESMGCFFEVFFISIEKYTDGIINRLHYLKSVPATIMDYTLRDLMRSFFLNKAFSSLGVLAFFWTLKSLFHFYLVKMECCSKKLPLIKLQKCSFPACIHRCVAQ